MESTVGRNSFKERKLLRIFVYPIKSCAPFEVCSKSLNVMHASLPDIHKNKILEKPWNILVLRKMKLRTYCKLYNRYIISSYCIYIISIWSTIYWHGSIQEESSFPLLFTVCGGGRRFLHFSLKVMLASNVVTLARKCDLNLWNSPATTHSRQVIYRDRSTFT